VFRFLFIIIISIHSAYAANHCVILQYHHFSTETPPITSISPQQFDDQLDYLQRNNFKILPLRKVIYQLQNQLELPDKCISLSIDDAYISIYQNAYPRLKKLGWPATVFVNTDAVDAGLKSTMNWQQMREMSQYGFSFENHSHSHLHMIRKKHNESDSAWLKRVQQDIQTAQNRILAEIGVQPTLLAYPYGEYTAELIELITSMGLVGFSLQSGPVWPGANFGALPRFPMESQYANMEGFITKVNSLPLPITAVFPRDPLVEPGQTRPVLKIQLPPELQADKKLRCYVSSSDQVDISWSDTDPGWLQISPKFDLSPGRHRTNCTMPSSQPTRFHWYSHSWYVRHDDGKWYAEY